LFFIFAVLKIKILKFLNNNILTYVRITKKVTNILYLMLRTEQVKRVGPLAIEVVLRYVLYWSFY